MGDKNLGTYSAVALVLEVIITLVMQELVKVAQVLKEHHSLVVLVEAAQQI